MLCLTIQVEETIFVPPFGVVHEASNKTPAFHSSDESFTYSSGLAFLQLIYITIFAIGGATETVVVASPSKIHSVSLFALLTVRCTT